jgi:FAD/FMN-containing dehydrogenase
MLAEEIKAFFKGEVLNDAETLSKYSHDASVFEIKPQVVVCPRDVEDLKALVKWAAAKKKAGDLSLLSLTARSGGTDMSGGAVNDSVIIDFSKHLNRFVSLSADKGGQGGSATVQPGMFYRDFEKETLKKGLLMPSYPASREICTVGGMVSNNSGGEKTLAYGKTEKYVSALKVVLGDGEEYSVAPLTKAELDLKMKQKGFEGTLYKKIFKLIKDNAKAIAQAKPDVSKNSAGYYLWNVWDGETFDLPKLVVGSQGTLGLVTEITFRLIRPKPHSLMAVLFLRDLDELGSIVETIMPFKPETLESYDDQTLKLAIRFFPQILARAKGSRIKLAFGFLPDLWMLLRHGWPKLVVLVELTGEDESGIRTRLIELTRALKEKSSVFRIKHKNKRSEHHDALVHLTKNQAAEEKYWITRRESFNLLRKNVKGKHTLPVVDDVIVKPEYLKDFLPEMSAILDKYRKYIFSTIAGHVGDGNFHIIPLMDFKNPAARAIVPKLMDEVYDLVLKYHGSITAEHNDGLIRTPYLEKMYGPKVVALFAEVKYIFDPLDLFNPRKKVGGTLTYAIDHIQKD